MRYFTSIFLTFIIMTFAPIAHAGDKFESKDLISKDALYEMDISGLKLGITAEEAATILEEKGFEGKFNFTDGRMMNGDHTTNTGTAKFVNPIDQITINLQSYTDPVTNKNHLYDIHYKQKFSSEQGVDAWKERVKKRYGDAPSREEDFAVYYSVVPILSSEHKSETYCRMAGRTGFPSREACSALDGDNMVLMFEMPFTNEIRLSIADKTAMKEANKVLKDTLQKELDENSKNQETMF